MRDRRIYILRLVVDSQLPGRLQGELWPVGKYKMAHPFACEQDLLDQLHRLTSALTGAAEAPIPPASANQEEKPQNIENIPDQDRSRKGKPK